MPFNYFGSQHTGIRPVTPSYGNFHNPQELYTVFRQLWCSETCSPSLRDVWSKENMTLGQCSITALLAQDIFGGELYGMKLPDGATHYYNVVDGLCFDLTSEQFGSKVGELSYEGNPKIDREKLLTNTQKKQRYELLKAMLNDYLNTK